MSDDRIPTITGSVPGIDSKRIDPTVSPRDNIVGYAAGRWPARFSKPTEVGRLDVYTIVSASIDERLLNLLEDCTQQVRDGRAAEGSIEQLLGRFCHNALNTERSEKVGVRPIQAMLDIIDKIHDEESFAAALASLHSLSITPLFEVKPVIDRIERKTHGYDSKQIAGIVAKPAFLELTIDTATEIESVNESSLSSEGGTDNVSYLVQLLELLGSTREQAAFAVSQIVDLETQFVDASQSIAEAQESGDDKAPDPKIRYSADDLLVMFPGFKWRTYFNGIGLSDSQTKKIAVFQPIFFQRISEMLQSVPIQTLKNYLRCCLIAVTAPYLGNDFVQATARSEGSAFESRRSLDWLLQEIKQSALSEALNELFVRTRCKPEIKPHAKEMAELLREAFIVAIQETNWLSLEFRHEAVAKVTDMVFNIAWPDTWAHKYQGLTIKEDDSYIEELLSLYSHQVNLEREEIGNNMRTWVTGV